MDNKIKEMITYRLVIPTLEHGMSDRKHQLILESIVRHFGGAVTAQEVFDEYDRQFTEALRKEGVIS